jgi:two-component system, chemotaxis family, protein-glutamate methylesterase/glutaminase
MPAQTTARDIIVIGGSAGAMQPLRSLAAALPKELPAALFVVMHISPSSPGLLPEILNFAGRLPAGHAQDGDRIEHGRICVAPPDHHLLLEHGTMHLARGPRENRFRPAIDPLFRTAARAYGGRVMAVLLSGGMNDGSYGMMLVKEHGGLTVVQDPAEAEAPAMVRSAMEVVDVDHALPVAEIAALIQEHARAPLPQGASSGAGGNSHPDPVEPENQGLPQRPAEGELVPFVCPECGGSLWESQHGRLTRYECHEGHAFSGELLLSEQSDAVEGALWSALRTLDENAELSRRIAARAREGRRFETAETFEQQARETAHRAEAIRRVLVKQSNGAGGRQPFSSTH